MTIRITLSNEYGLPFPVSSRFGDSLEDELPLTQELRDRIRAWALHFNLFYDPETGWRDAGASWQEHVREARTLADALRRELGAAYDVELRLWEFNGIPEDQRVTE